MYFLLQTEEGDPKVKLGYPLEFCSAAILLLCKDEKNIAIPLTNIGIAIVCLENIYYLYTTT